MEKTLTLSSLEQLKHFYQVSDGNWKNAIYLFCDSCPLLSEQACKNLLCVFDIESKPVIIPVIDAESLWDETIDKSNCISVMGTQVFMKLHWKWFLENMENPFDCRFRECFDNPTKR